MLAPCSTRALGGARPAEHMENVSEAAAHPRARSSRVVEGERGSYALGSLPICVAGGAVRPRWEAPQSWSLPVEILRHATKGVVESTAGCQGF